MSKSRESIFSSYTPPPKCEILSESFKDELLNHKMGAVVATVKEALSDADNMRRVVEEGKRITISYSFKTISELGLVASKDLQLEHLARAMEQGFQAAFDNFQELPGSNTSINIQGGFDEEDPFKATLAMRVLDDDEEQE